MNRLEAHFREGIPTRVWDELHRMARDAARGVMSEPAGVDIAVGFGLALSISPFRCVWIFRDALETRRDELARARREARKAIRGALLLGEGSEGAQRAADTVSDGYDLPRGYFNREMAEEGGWFLGGEAEFEEQFIQGGYDEL